LQGEKGTEADHCRDSTRNHKFIKCNTQEELSAVVHGETVLEKKEQTKASYIV
jgi:hypothetical protein